MAEQANAPAPDKQEADEATVAAVAQQAKTAETEKKIHFTAPDVPEGQHFFWGLGRRKASTARVRIRPGGGTITINKREMETFFPLDGHRNDVIAPLRATKMLKDWDIWCNVRGGGITGQAGAISLGLARAIAEAVPEAENVLRQNGLLTRDARTVERKKPGQKGARKRFQFSKR